eukprot:6415233-Pyramimonas_sp.AAC.1
MVGKEVLAKMYEAKVANSGSARVSLARVGSVGRTCPRRPSTFSNVGDGTAGGGSPPLPAGP